MRTLRRWISFIRHPSRYAIVIDNRGLSLLPMVSGGLPQNIDNQTAKQATLDRVAVMNDSVSAHNLFMGLQDADTATTVGAAGGAAALPATPLGYAFCSVGGVVVKVPYFNP